MREEVMKELGATDDTLRRSIHSVYVRGLVELDLVIAGMLILEGKFLPGLGHADNSKRIKM
jgi:hypothetical protein